MEEPTGIREAFLHEATDSLRKAKEVVANDIEWTLANRKLDLIQNKPDATPLADDTFLQSKINTRKLRYKGLMEDCESPETDSLMESVKKLEETTDKAMREEFADSAKAYEDLHIKEGDDLTVVAKNDTERAMIMDAAKLLNYFVKENGAYPDGKPKLEFYPPEKFKTGGDLEKVLSTRIEVGIKNMLDDFGEMRDSATMIGRPVIRTIVSMVDAEAKVFRSPAREIHPN